MNEITLKYGRGSITLSKSPALIGVAASTPTTIGGLSAGPILPLQEGAGARRLLGGFELHLVAAAGMERQLDELRNSPAVRAGTHVWHTSRDDPAPVVPTGEVFVRWTETARAPDRAKLLADLRLSVVAVRGPRESLLRVTEASPNPLKVASMLQASALVAVAEPDLAVSGKLCAVAVPPGEALDRQWHLRNTGNNGGSFEGLVAGADARVVEAWDRGGSLGSSGVVVAVIDDGFDLGHPDLSGPGKIVAPWDFTRGSENPAPEYGLRDGRFDGDWHGTACAGVAVGNADGTGVVGAAPGCRLLPVRWGAGISDADIEAWFDYVRTQGAAVVNCSWGVNARVYELSTRQHEAIARCAREGRGGLGTVIVFAAGNENSDVNAPPFNVAGFAIHPDVICVAASTSRDEPAHYSNFGREVWVCAPSSGAGGRGIVTADVRGSVVFGGRRYELGYASGGMTADFGGTSSATPLVVGVCALLLSLRPDLTASQVKEVLRRTARKIGSATEYDLNGHSPRFGFGCVDAAAAVASVIGAAPAAAAKIATGRTAKASPKRTGR